MPLAMLNCFFTGAAKPSLYSRLRPYLRSTPSTRSTAPRLSALTTTTPPGPVWPTLTSLRWPSTFNTAAPGKSPTTRTWGAAQTQLVASSNQPRMKHLIPCIRLLVAVNRRDRAAASAQRPHADDPLPAAVPCADRRARPAPDPADYRQTPGTAAARSGRSSGNVAEHWWWPAAHRPRSAHRYRNRHDQGRAWPEYRYGAALRGNRASLADSAGTHNRGSTPGGTRRGWPDWAAAAPSDRERQSDRHRKEGAGRTPRRRLRCGNNQP